MNKKIVKKAVAFIIEESIMNGEDFAEYKTLDDYPCYAGDIRTSIEETFDISLDCNEITGDSDFNDIVNAVMGHLTDEEENSGTDDSILDRYRKQFPDTQKISVTLDKNLSRSDFEVRAILFGESIGAAVMGFQGSENELTMYYSFQLSRNINKINATGRARIAFNNTPVIIDQEEHKPFFSGCELVYRIKKEGSENSSDIWFVTSLIPDE